MSVHAPAKPITVPQLRAMKGTPQVWLTAYTTPMAELLDPHCDVLLVGDSLGMVLYGLPSTLGVSLDTMIAHGAAVVRGAAHACIVVDCRSAPISKARNRRLPTRRGCWRKPAHPPSSWKAA